MPRARRLTLLVNPSFAPMRCSPACRRCSTTSAWALYAVSASRKGFTLLNGAMGVRSRCAVIRASAIALGSVTRPHLPRRTPRSRSRGARTAPRRRRSGGPARGGAAVPTARCRLARNPRWGGRSLLASQLRHRTGLPSAAAPAPLSTGEPLRYRSIPARRRSTAVAGVIRLPRTTLPAEALSATVSASCTRQSAMRLSTISIAGRTPPIAVSASTVVTPGPARSRAITKAISATTRGWRSDSTGTSSPSSTNMSSISMPKSGSVTPSISCRGCEVRPSLQPLIARPASTRRRTLYAWIA